MNTKQPSRLKHITAYFTPDLIQKLKASAQKYHRSVNSELTWALEQYLNQQEKQSEKIS